MVSVPVVVSRVPLPVQPRRLNAEAGLRVLHLAGSQCLVGWVEGQQSFRAGVLDVGNGTLNGAVPIKGELTGVLADDRVLWLLTSHGLQEIDRELFVVRRSLRAGLPEYAARLLPVAPHHALVVVRYRQSHAIVDLRTMSITKRVRVPEPAVAVAVEGGTALLSLRYGIRRHLTDELKFAGGADPIPMGTGAVRDGERAVFVTAPRKPTAKIIGEVGLDPDRYVDVAPSGTVAWLGGDGIATRAPAPAQVSWIHGRTSGGDLVGTDGSLADGISRLTVLAADGHTVRGSHDFSRRAGMVAVLPGSAALSTPGLFGDPRSAFELLRW